MTVFFFSNLPSKQIFLHDIVVLTSEISTVRLLSSPSYPITWCLFVHQGDSMTSSGIESSRPSKNRKGINQNQFAVLLLASEEEFKDLDSMAFRPSREFEPLTNCGEVSMPSERKRYRNYIVARYESISESSDKVVPIDRHSEETIISELDHLWKGYSAAWLLVPLNHKYA